MVVNTISKKVCLLGHFAVGKTSLVRRFVYDLFSEKYISTIGVNVRRKTIAISVDDSIVELRMMLWDLAGSEEFEQVRPSYLQGAAGAVLVCDLTRPETLDSLCSYADDVARISPHARFVVAANKYDLAGQQQLTVAQIESVATQLKAPYYLTSAMTGLKVETVFRTLGERLLL